MRDKTVEVARVVVAADAAVVADGLSSSSDLTASSFLFFFFSDFVLEAAGKASERKKVYRAMRMRSSSA